MSYFKRLAKASSVTFALAGFVLTGQAALAQEAAAETEAEAPVTVGGAEMLPTRNIVENAMNSPIHTRLVAALQQAGLVETLSGPGPYTVFAPTDEAFGFLGEETIDALMQDGARAQLTQILSYHVLPGAIDAATLRARIAAAGGELVLTPIEGSPLRATIVNDFIALHDELGGTAYVTQADVPQSNGVIHVVNGLLIPEPETAAAE